jgi:hypothetical protein
MKTVTIYTNGKSLFTLESYDKAAGVSHANGITINSVVNALTARAMHEKGKLHYIFGIGDRKVICGIALNRKMNLTNFNIC